MFETLATDDGPSTFPGLGLDGTTSEAQTARSAFVACSSATATTRDLFPLLGLSAPTQGLSNVQTELNSVLSMDFAPILAEYQALNDQAVQAGPASSTGAYTCETWTNGAQAASSSCDWVTFKANYQTLVQQALQIGQTISTQLGVQKQSGSDWNSMNTKLQEVTGSQSLTRLQSGLNCEEVFNSWQIVQDQVCAGLADMHSTAGFGWMLAGALGFVGALGQYWIWRLLKDNRSLYLDEHDELRVRGWRRCVCCFCATSLGDLDDDAGLGKSEEEPKEQGSEPATPKKGGGKTSVASKRIVDGFFQDPATAIENNVRNFLADELFPTYDATFKNFAIGERVASWKALEKDKQSRGDTEVQPPGEAPTDPATLLAEYGDRGPDGVPIADASGEKLDKKTMAKLKKELALLQKPWDKWNNDKSKYEAYLLSKIRRRCLEQYAEVQYTEEVEHLRPLSPTSGAPLVVVVQEVPEDPTRAIWSDELQQISPERLDAKVRKEKNMVKKLKGLEAKCFGSFDVQDPLMNRLMAICDDPAIWEDVKIEKATKMKAPKEPKEPKGLCEPSEVFKSGKHEGAYSEYDAKGIPTKLEDGSDIPDKKRAALTKEYEAARKKWDTHQAAVAKYNRDLTQYEKQQSGDDEGVPEKQRRSACEAAAVDILRNVINKLVAYHAKDLATEVNKGSEDPDDLAAIIVKVSLEHEDKTTDPVLKALKTVDKKKRSGHTEIDELPEVFRLLKEDELQVGSHVCFGDITQEEIEFITTCLEGNGSIPHEDLKTFLESQDLQLSDGKPTSLAGCLVTMRLENFQSESKIEQLMSPRTWRIQLGGELPGQSVPGKSGEEPVASNEIKEEAKEEGKEEADKKEKKEKKEKKDKKEKEKKKDKK